MSQCPSSSMAKRRHPGSNAGRQGPGRPCHRRLRLRRRIQAAHRLWNEGQQADALSLFAEAVRQEPNNVRTYVMAARAYAEKFDFERMERTHDKLIRRAPRHPGVHHYIGETYALLKLPDRAIASFAAGRAASRRRAAHMDGTCFALRTGPPAGRGRGTYRAHGSSRIRSAAGVARAGTNRAAAKADRSKRRRRFAHC